MKCCVLDREVDLDETRASLRLVRKRRRGTKARRCLPTLHYSDPTGNYRRTHPSGDDGGSSNSYATAAMLLLCFLDEFASLHSLNLKWRVA